MPHSRRFICDASAVRGMLMAISLTANMFAQSSIAGPTGAIGTARQVYDGTLTSDIQVNTFRNIDRLFPVRVVKHGPNVLALPRAATPLTKLEFNSAGKTL
jgi:hypothetical protein